MSNSKIWMIWIEWVGWIRIVSLNSKHGMDTMYHVLHWSSKGSWSRETPGAPKSQLQYEATLRITFVASDSDFWPLTTGITWGETGIKLFLLGVDRVWRAYSSKHRQFLHSRTIITAKFYLDILLCCLVPIRVFGRCRNLFQMGRVSYSTLNVVFAILSSSTMPKW